MTDANKPAQILCGPLRLNVPPEWRDESSVSWNGGLSAALVGPEDSAFRTNLIFSSEPTRPGETPSDFAARQLPMLKAGVPNYQLISERSARFGPNTGVLREHTMNGDRIGQLQFYIVIADTAFTFTFTQLKEKLDKYKPLAFSLFERVRLDPRTGAATADADCPELPLSPPPAPGD